MNIKEVVKGLLDLDETKVNVDYHYHENDGSIDIKITKLDAADKQNEIPPRYVEMIHTILKEFDFERVQNIMESLKWEWFIEYENRYRVPNIDDLKKCAEKLLVDVVKETQDLDVQMPVFFDAGGFRAWAEINGAKALDSENYIILRLEFIVLDYACYE